jgi:hypothetical protein
MNDAFELSDPSADARAAILSRTLGVQRRRRMVRGAAAIAIVAVAYAAGFATPRPVAAAVIPQAPAVEKPFSDPHPVSDSSDRERRAILEASNHELGDVESALRCYRQFLKIPQTRDAKAEAEDSWLLAALRRSKG